MYDLWTWTTVWGLPEGGGVGWRGQRGKNWDGCNSLINKIKFKK